MRIPTRAARLGLHGMRQQVVHLAGGSVQGPATRVAQALKPGMQVISAFALFIQSHSGLSLSGEIMFNLWRLKHTTHAVSVGQGMLLRDGRDISTRSYLGLAMTEL